MNKKGISKLLSLLLVISMILPNVVMATGELKEEGKKEIVVGLEETKDSLKEKLEKEVLKDREIKNDLFEEEKKDVRVMVEVEGIPLVVQATNQGKKVSQLGNSKIASAESKLLSVQNSVKNNIKQASVKIDYLNSYTTIFNGFSALVSSDEIEALEDIKGVKRVELVNEYERPEISAQPRMNTSGGMVGAPETWDTGYNGEGMLVAVLDTGADPFHRDFNITDEAKVALTEKKVNEIITLENLEGKYYNIKVPYAYNYYDKSNVVIKDDGPSQHGMHVAGTVVANGDEAKGGIKGIAPEAQLLNMKVFSNDPIYSTTFTDIYVKAIDDAVKLGVDAINMSLGAEAGYHVDNGIEQKALQNANDNGIICSISAGNGRNTIFGSEVIYGTKMKSFEFNPDTGVLGSPSANKAAFSVASFENDSVVQNYLTSNPKMPGELEKGALVEVASIPFSSLNNPEGYAYVEVGTGGVEEFDKVDVKGKIALVKRGKNFTETIVFAQERGAIGCIVYNHEAGGDDLINMAGGDLAKIPFGFTTNSIGKEILKDANRKLIFPEGNASFPNPLKGNMSDFSSWGTTPDLQLKPELTAPGGNIYSTQNNNGYTIMSGTSMSSPHSAGGSVLVKDYIKKNADDFGNLTGKQINELTRVLMMNTATPKNQPGTTVPYGARVQGAGMMNLEKATSNKVTILDNDNLNSSFGKAKVELGVINETAEGKINFKLKLKNYGSETIKFTPKIEVIQEKIVNGKLEETFELMDTSINSTIILESGEEKEIDINTGSLDLINNQFVDGFIKFEADVAGRDLVVPFLGFKGKWDEPRIIDTFDAKYLLQSQSDDFIDNRGHESQFKMSGMIESGFWGDSVLKPGEIYFNPGTGSPYDGASLVPYISQLRNARTMRYSILDKDSNLLRVLGVDQYTRKVNSMNRGVSPVRVASKGAWNGKISGEIVQDGRYKYLIESELDYKGMNKQEDIFDLLIDRERPLFAKNRGKFDRDRNTFTFEARDEILEGLTVNDISGIKYVVLEDATGKTEICEIGKSDKLDVKSLDVSKNHYEITVNLTEYLADRNNTVRVTVADGALNTTENSFTLDIDNSKGMLVVGKPQLFGVGSSNNKKDLEEGKMFVEVEGYVCGWEKLSKVLADGNDIDFSYEEETELTVNGELIYKGPAYHFRGYIRMPNGYHTMEIKAFDEDNGKELSVSRSFYIDLEEPKFEKVEVGDVNNNKVNIDLTISDSLDQLSLYNGDSFVWDTDGESVPNGTPTRQDISGEVSLNPGVNRIDFILKDRIFTVKESLFIFNPSHLNPGVSVDVDKLLELLKEAESANTRMRTPESIAALNAAKDNAYRLLSEDKKDLNQEEVTKAEEKLRKAIDGLEKIFVDKSVLQALYDEGKSKNKDDYTLESYGYLHNTLQQVEKILDDEYADQMTVDRWVAELRYAIKLLTPKVEPVDKTELETEIEKAKKIDLEKYTDETASRLKKSIEKAVIVYEDEDASQEEVSRAVEAIEEAIKGLVKVDKETEGPEVIVPEDPGTPIYPTLPPVEEKPEEPKPEEPESPEKEEKTAVEKKLEFEDYKGYVNGYKDGSFRAENEISREEVATIINNLLNDEYREDLKIKEIDFKDVKEGRWSEDAIKTIYSMELIEGYKDGSFRPEANITRAEFATILNRLGELELGEIKVELDDIKGHWGEEDITNVMSNGWGDKIEKDKFRPDDNLLRYEMVVMINKVLELDSEDLEEAERLEFEDLTGKEWYYDEIMKAVIFE